MSRFDGYNRNDFHYARTSREAFGDKFYVEEEEHQSVKAVVFIVCIVLLVTLSVWLQLEGLK